MTRHNLAQHLAWLIGSNPLRPPQQVYTPPSTAPSSVPELIHEDYSPPLIAGSSLPEVGGAPVRSRNGGGPESQKAFPPPSIPASVLNACGKEAMARLQSGPASSHKARLLSGNLPHNIQTSSVAGARATGHTVKDLYTAKWEQSASGKSILHTSAFMSCYSMTFRIQIDSPTRCYI